MAKNDKPNADADEMAKRSGPPPDPADDATPKPLADPDAGFDSPDPSPQSGDDKDPGQVPHHYTERGDNVPMDPAAGLSPDAQQPFESYEDYQKRTGKD